MIPKDDKLRISIKISASSPVEAKAAAMALVDAVHRDIATRPRLRQEREDEIRRARELTY